MTVRESRDGSRWQATGATLVAVALCALLPPRYTIGPVWVAPAIVLVILIPLLVMHVASAARPAQRAASISLIAVVNFFNAASVVLLVYYILTSSRHETGVQLLMAGSQIWLTNILVFALWFWELDGGGPLARADAASEGDNAEADFLFPQMMADPARSPWVPAGWKPKFADYLYLGFTNATAFSPTDVMPLSPMAKMLMLVESLISLVTLALILARSVNILT
ncbi:MAG: hypothetical protein ACREMP_00935 [Candidatus Tyrphobacter sp.]